MLKNDLLSAAIESLAPAERIVVFTGAGISAEAGIPTFRDPKGMWNQVDPKKYHINNFLVDPEIRIERWQNTLKGMRGGPRSSIKPTPAHYALTRLWKADRMSGCITQNVDGLHIQAGLPEKAVAELHGTVWRSECYKCKRRWPTETVLDWVEAGQPDPICPECGGVMKLATVLFGEKLHIAEMAKAQEFADQAQAMLAIGSTLSVFPAVNFVIEAHQLGKPVVLVNLGETEKEDRVSVRITGKAGEVIPDLVDALLASN